MLINSNIWNHLISCKQKTKRMHSALYSSGGRMMRFIRVNETQRALSRILTQVTYSIFYVWNLQNNVRCIPCSMFSSKHVYKKAKHGLATKNQKKKNVVWKPKIFWKRKMSRVQKSIKKVILIAFWDINGTIIIDFLGKRKTLKSAFYGNLIKKTHYIYWITNV